MVKDQSFTVDEASTVLPFLLQKMPSRGRNKVKALLLHRQVSVDGKMVTRHDHPLSVGQVVTILAKGFRKEGWAQLDYGLKLLYEDEHLLIVDKPPGLLTIATDQEKLRTAYRVLTDYVKDQEANARVFIVHRLDRETSGILMFAKTEAVKLRLQQAWTELVFERQYVAVVEGSVSRQEGLIDTWLKETATKLMVVTPEGIGERARTHYRVIKKTHDYTQLAVRLDTGKKNQIRVHMQAMGHPVAGDKRYGAKTDPLHRLGLHARILAFYHPVSQVELRFETAVPPLFETLFHRDTKGDTTLKKR